MTNDCVVSYHLNPQTCGVAKFNLELAKRLGVPCYKLWDDWHKGARYPLLSIKPFEIAESLLVIAEPGQPYDLFLHGEGMDKPGVQRAQRVFAASRELGFYYRQFRSDVVDVWCPSTINGNPTRGVYRVLTFGMAHKLAIAQYRQLKHRLDSEGKDYTIEWSMAHHHGTEPSSEQEAAMRGIFGSRLRVLGALGDDALAKELQDCDAVAVYFDPAVRENNTTVWSAVAAGKTLYTNTDDYSPVLDPARYSWEGLVQLVCDSGR